MAQASKHLVFVWTTSGYELSERAGEPPAAGSEVEDGEQRFLVVRVGPSPLPADDRRCAYLQPV
jgi:hypothetical protein